MIRLRVLLLALGLSGSLGAGLDVEADASVPGDAEVEHFVILLYHHVSDATPPSTSVTPAQFDAHLDWLVEHEYQVWPLSRALDAVLDGGGVPDRVVALTFDDAYESVYTEAWPRLRERGWTASVFVNSGAIDQQQDPYMTWDQLRELGRAGFEIGNHSESHLHAGRLRPGESPAQWRTRVLEDFQRAQDRITAELGTPPQSLAWPYGEDVPELRDDLAQRYAYGLAQRSGAVGPGADPMALPRFPMARSRADLDRLALTVRTRPLRLVDARTEPERVRGMVAGPSALSFNLTGADGTSGRLSCFLASGQALEFDQPADSGERIRIELPRSARPGRHKVNCTASAADGSGDFHWGSIQWVQPPADGGDWPD